MREPVGALAKLCRVTSSLRIAGLKFAVALQGGAAIPEEDPVMPEPVSALAHLCRVAPSLRIAALKFAVAVQSGAQLSQGRTQFCVSRLVLWHSFAELRRR